MTNQAAATNLWTVDPAHTTVGFNVRHLMITNVRGMFEEVQGTVEYDPAHLKRTRIHIEIPVRSVNTRVAQRDAHLRSGDFFDAETHPTATFQSTEVVAVAGAGAGDRGVATVRGDLTLRGVTRPVVFLVEEVTGEQRDHNGATKIGASATAKIKRSDFGIAFNRVLEAGGVAIADEVALTLDLALVKAAGR